MLRTCRATSVVLVFLLCALATTASAQIELFAQGATQGPIEPQAVRSAISRAKNELLPPSAYPATVYYAEVVKRVYERYQKLLTTSGALDFDDLLMLTVQMFRNNSSVLAAYQANYGAPMPVDVWGMHTYMLQEVAGDWGADVPPGIEFDPSEGMRWTVEEHDSLALVEGQVRRMREWMAARGYRGQMRVLHPPHLSRQDHIVLLLSTIFLLSIVALSLLTGS